MTPISSHRGVLRLETCSGSWLVDLARSRYCRAERGTSEAFLSPLSWQPFHALLVGDGGLVRLVLDRRGASGVSGWLHTDECRRCGDQGLRKPA